MQRTTITLRGVRLVRAETVVLDEVDATFERGFTAVVGESGAGKTTLLEAITGTLAPARGALRVEPDDALVVLCAQRVDEPDARVLELARAHDRSARRWRARLSLDDDALGRWPTLSPGERKRWQVAAALAARADVLLLDEPTNHVDAETRALLVGALARFGGVALLVSHDRALIDALATRTLWLEERRAVELELPYAEAREALRLRRASAIDAHQRARRRLERVEGRLAAARERTRHADRDKKSGRRMKSTADSDARSAAAKGRAAKGAARGGRQVTLLAREQQRAEHALDAAPVTRRRGGALTIARAPARASAPHLCRLQAAQLRAGDRVLMREIDVCVQRDTRLHISGPNGAGKSTLLRAIERAVSLPREQLLVLPQELGEAACRALLERIRALGPGERGQLLALAARLGLAPSRLLDSQLPSPGEARKLCLAEGLSREVALVLLDEPENHLDLPALERLEQCLAEYQGALVLVTHDEALAQTLCDQRLEVSRDTT